MQALATRCPECSTSFRVQAAQLGASQGFVRCGRCDAVFDARLSLFDLNDGQAVAWSPAPADATADGQATQEPAGASTAAVEPDEGVPGGVESAADRPEPAWRDDPSEAPAIHPATPAPQDHRAEPGWREPSMDEVAAHEDPLAPADVNERLRALLGGDGSNPSPAASAWSSLAPAPTPQAGSRWLTGMGWLAVAGLALALPLQWGWTERAALRARSPALDQAWRQVCPSCDAPAWAQIDGLRVGASSLRPTPQGQAYQLQITLHNGAGHALALPWLDLRLQDAQGRVVVRRSVSPQELGARADRLAAGGQITLQGSFRVDADRRGAGISGYEVGLFHP